MDAKRFQILRRWKRGRTRRGGEGGKGGEEGVERGTETGENELGGGSHGMDTRLGTEGFRGDRAEVRIAIEICVWSSQSEWDRSVLKLLFC